MKFPKEYRVLFYSFSPRLDMYEYSCLCTLDFSINITWLYFFVDFVGLRRHESLQAIIEDLNLYYTSEELKVLVF